MKWKRGNKAIEEPLVDYLEKLFDETLAKGYTFTVSIGTDSQKSGKGYRFATIILIAMKENMGGGVERGRGGMIVSSAYFMDLKAKDKAGVNERMLVEVGKSIEVAYEIAPLLDLYGIKMEVHADINPDPRWESNKALNHAIGYILGMGYEFKVKPSAWAASFGADRFCS